MGKLAVKGIRALTEPGRYGDGATLFLSVAPGGSKSWIQRVTVDGKRRDIGLGGFPVVSLATARRRAFDNRVAIAEGRNPLDEKRKAAIPTFREACQRAFEANRPRWRNAKHVKNWMQSMERYAFPVIGDVSVNRITRGDVLAILTPIWTSRPETARRLRQRIRSVLRWSEAQILVEHNAACEAADVTELTGLTRYQLREWSARDRRDLVRADFEPDGPRRHALFTWQTVLALRLLKTLHTDFAVEIGAWAPGINRLRQTLERVSFPCLWGSLVHFASRENPELVSTPQSLPLAGVVLPLDPHLVVIARKLTLTTPDQLFLFPAPAVSQ